MELTYINSTSEEYSRYKSSYIQCLKTKYSVFLYKFLHQVTYSTQGQVTTTAHPSKRHFHSSQKLK